MKNRLEQLRRERGLRQEELAEALEVSRQTIGSLENGRYNPSILLAFKLARYFDCAIEDIFIYEEDEVHEADHPCVMPGNGVGRGLGVRGPAGHPGPVPAHGRVRDPGPSGGASPSAWASRT